MVRLILGKHNLADGRKLQKYMFAAAFVLSEATR